jgi:hypothetical protein
MFTVLGFLDLNGVAIGVIALLLLIVWWWQFIQLMMFSDSDFPGRYDKPLWAVLFIVACVIAPFLFMHWKSAYLTMRADTRNEKTRI